MTNQTEQGAALLPCPLCGAEAQLVDFAGYEVLCACGLNYCDGTDASAEAAARGWNRRATIPTSEGYTSDGLTPYQEERISAFQAAAPNSLAMLREFTAARPAVADASVFMTEDGNLSLQWSTRDGGTIEAQFLPATPGDSHAT